MNVSNSKTMSSQLLNTMKSVSLSKLVSRLKPSKKAAKAPADMEVDNLDWYRTIPVKK